MTRTLTQERERGLRRILVAAPLFPPAFLGGGPIRTLDALVSQAPARFNVRVITRDRDLGAHERLGQPTSTMDQRIACGACSAGIGRRGESTRTSSI